MRYRKQATSLAATVVVCLALVSLAPRPAGAQPTFSIDFQGPTRFAPDGFGGIPILEGDLLVPIPPGTPPPFPGILIPAALPGLGILVPPAANFAEVDALSFGVDPPLGSLNVTDFAFSVGEFSIGIPGQGPTSVGAQGAVGFAEATADIFISTVRPGPVPLTVRGFNRGFLDGNGIPPFGGGGINLVEPNPPTPLGVPDPGDNLDALDMDTPPAHPIFFSLDSFYLDPLEIPPANTGSAFINGAVGGDVLVTPMPNVPPALYATAAQLGLDFNGVSPDTDDVDALVVWDDGDLQYNPTLGPYSWEAGTDMVLYSIRRGSSIISLPDVLQLLPIEEGDILVPVWDPVDGMPLFDGVEGDYDPGIFVTAEALGLATVRSGTAFGGWGVVNPVYGVDIWADELCALDELPGAQWIVFADDFESGDVSAWSGSAP